MYVPYGRQNGLNFFVDTHVKSGSDIGKKKFVIFSKYFFSFHGQRRALQLVVILLLLLLLVIIDIDIIRTLKVSIVGRAPSFFMIILLQNT